MKRIEKLPANRLKVLKGLLMGGRVEKRRVYPYSETYHLKRPEVVETPPKVAEVVMVDLIDHGLIAPSIPLNLNVVGAADNIDYVITPAGMRAHQLKGVEYEDVQDTLFGDDAGKYDERRITGMEAA